MTAVQNCNDGVCVIGCEPFIEARDVSLRYGRRPTLRNVNLKVPACQITAIIGPSGSGKTSFLSCINRLTDLVPECEVTGSLRVGSVDVRAPSTDLLQLRRRIGMVFQKPNPFPLSIWKNVALPLGQHGVTRRSQVAERVETALRDVGLWDEVKDRLDESALRLSGGQQQRLCIARSIALRPDALLLDEPCSALDPLASAHVERLIIDLRRKYTVVIVTHNLAQAQRIADRVGVFWMEDGVGTLIEQGAVQQVFGQPSHPETAAYLSGRVG